MSNPWTRYTGSYCKINPVLFNSTSITLSWTTTSTLPSAEVSKGFPSMLSLCHICYPFSIASRVIFWKCEQKLKCPSDLHLNWKSEALQFSCSVVSDSLRLHESQLTRPPCPSPTPRVHSDSRPSSRWCHLAISSSVVPFSSCPPIPASIRVFSNESTLHMRWPKY